MKINDQIFCLKDGPNLNLMKGKTYEFSILYKNDGNRLPTLKVNDTSNFTPNFFSYAPFESRTNTNWDKLKRSFNKNILNYTDDLEEEEKDTDGDGIPDSWETNGYTAFLDKNNVVCIKNWEESFIDKGYKKYISSPMKSSTASDPYTDYQKVTGIMLDSNIKKEAQNPMIAAYPDIQLIMEKYKLIPNVNFSEQYGGAATKQITRGTSNTMSTTNSWGTQVTAHASIFDFGCSVSASYDSSQSTVVTKDESISDSTTEDWNTTLGLNNMEAAQILPNVRYKNVGTAPAYEVYPQFTLSLEKEKFALMTSQIGEAQKASKIMPDNLFPSQNEPPLAFDRPSMFNNPILIDTQTISKLQNNETLNLTTNSFNSNVLLFSAADGTPYLSNQSWETIIPQIKKNTAEIIIQFQDGPIIKRNIAAPGNSLQERSVPSLKLKEAIKEAFDGIDSSGNLSVQNKLISSLTTQVEMDEFTYNTLINNKSGESLLNQEIKAGMHIQFNVTQPGIEKRQISYDVGQVSWNGYTKSIKFACNYMGQYRLNICESEGINDRIPAYIGTTEQIIVWDSKGNVKGDLFKDHVQSRSERIEAQVDQGSLVFINGEKAGDDAGWYLVWNDDLCYIQNEVGVSEAFSSLQELFSDRQLQTLKKDLTIDSFHTVKKNIDNIQDTIIKGVAMNVYNRAFNNFHKMEDSLKILDELCKFATIDPEVTYKGSISISPVYDPDLYIDNNKSFDHLFLWEKSLNAINPKYRIHLTSIKGVYAISSANDDYWIRPKFPEVNSPLILDKNKSNAALWHIKSIKTKDGGYFSFHFLEKKWISFKKQG